MLKPGDAYRIVEDMQKLHGVKPDRITFNSLLTTFARVGNIDGAERVFQVLECV